MSYNLKKKIEIKKEMKKMNQMSNKKFFIGNLETYYKIKF